MQGPILYHCLHFLSVISYLILFSPHFLSLLFYLFFLPPSLPLLSISYLITIGSSLTIAGDRVDLQWDYSISPIGPVKITAEQVKLLNPIRLLLYCTLLSTPHYTILYHTILYYTIPYYTISYHTILYYTILYYTIPHYTILYYIILYYTRLDSTRLHLYVP